MKRAVLTCIFTIVLVNGAVALVSKATGLPYRSFGWLELIIYVSVGQALRGSAATFGSAAAGMAVVAAAAAPVGWWLAWMIVPGAARISIIGGVAEIVVWWLLGLIGVAIGSRARGGASAR
jgi:hypothetical protein